MYTFLLGTLEGRILFTFSPFFLAMIGYTCIRDAEWFRNALRRIRPTEECQEYYAQELA